MIKKFLNKLSTFILYFSILLFIIAFNFAHNPPSGWYQQFLPSNLPNFQVSDMTFLDSLTGWVVTGNGNPNDSSGYILKTTNGGDNWTLQLAERRDFSRVKFLNSNTGFVSGGYYTGARLYKTTNGGTNWFLINGPGGQIFYDNMSVLNEDTMWIAISQSLTGGIFRTTNGGMNWERQLNLGSQNPDRIYMFNARIGFISLTNTYTRKTTNGGQNWFVILNGESFRDIYFIDSLKGWRAYSNNMYVTTNGGNNWITQLLPSGGIIITTAINKFSNINSDTIWGAGGIAFYGAGQFRSIIYRSTNGGTNWFFQVPDTTIHSGTYQHIQFVDKLKGWAYWAFGGIRTSSGGDTNWLTRIKPISNYIPKDYKLYQNYPNPFNPNTIIKYQIVKTKYVKLIIYDITGKQIVDLVNRRQVAGTYEVDFSGKGYSSGIYFYSLIVDGVIT